MKYLCVVQARLGSTRFSSKVLQTVGGVPMVRRVWLAAKMSWADKVIVAWPERYPALDENDVLGRFRRISQEFPSKYIIRLTSDCPLLSWKDINEAIKQHAQLGADYVSCGKDGYDVQIFPYQWLYDEGLTNREHVLNYMPKEPHMSVNTKEDLQKVRQCVTK